MHSLLSCLIFLANLSSKASLDPRKIIIMLMRHFMRTLRKMYILSLRLYSIHIKIIFKS